MPVVTLSPVSLAVTNYNTLKPSSIIGGDGALGDGSDSTYGEVWTSWDGSVEPIDHLSARFPAIPDAAVINSLSINTRLELFNEGSASSLRFEASFNDNQISGNEWICDITTAQVESASTVAAASTIYDLPTSVWSGPGGDAGDISIGSPAVVYGAALTALLAGRFEVDLQRFTETVPVATSHWGIRVFELSLVVDYDGVLAPAPLRLYPRSSTRIYPRRRTRRPGTF